MKAHNVGFETITEAIRPRRPLGPMPRKMSLPEKAEVLFRIQNEGGMEYTFCNYSNFSGVKDPEFHRIRKQFVAAANQMEKFLRAGFTQDQIDSIDNEESPFEDEEEAPDVYGRD